MKIYKFLFLFDLSLFLMAQIMQLTINFTTRPLTQYKDSVLDSQYKYEMVMWLSYLYDGNSYTDKTTSLHWNCPRMPQVPILTRKNTVQWQW